MRPVGTMYSEGEVAGEKPAYLMPVCQHGFGRASERERGREGKEGQLNSP